MYSLNTQSDFPQSTKVVDLTSSNYVLEFLLFSISFFFYWRHDKISLTQDFSILRLKLKGKILVWGFEQYKIEA